MGEILLDTDVLANWGQILEGVGVLITISCGLGALYWKMNIEIGKIKAELRPFRATCDKTQKLEIQIHEHATKINDFLPQMSSLLNKIDETNGNMNQLVASVSSLTTSVEHMVKQVDNSAYRIEEFGQRLARLEGYNEKN